MIATFSYNNRHLKRNHKKFNFLLIFFPDWADKDEDAGDVNVWEDNWDDDNVEDDFSRQLRYYQF